MITKTLENNMANVSGAVKGAPEFDHEIFGERFFRLELDCCRASGTEDSVPVIISERLVNIEELRPGDFLNVNGQFRSYNKHEGGRSRLVLFVFAQEAELGGHEDYCENEIKLEGYICKAPNHRTTPLGREITDVLLAVNRPYGKSDYIPCIVWGRNARYASSFDVGSMIKAHGRIQSRKYIKKTDQGEEERVAYEVSVNNIELCL